LSKKTIKCREKEKDMNIAEAKNISIVGYLASMGIEPDSYSNGRAWYCSPLRPGEKTPSFKVNTRINKWKDFGSDGKGGDLVDLICKMHGVSTTGALLILESPEIAHQKSLSFRGELSDNGTDGNRLTIQHVRPLQNRALIQYIEGRGITAALATHYCKEAYYTLTNPATDEVKKYFSIAFENDRHGWELRNRYFKNSASPKSVTTIPGTMGNMLSIFEGFVDLLSACQYYKVTKPVGSIIVLNSTVHTKDVFHLLPQFEKINLYLDNDPSGERATNEIKARHKRVTDYSKIIYPDNKDFNEFLINNLKNFKK
jgi:hypothetical protein